MARRGVELSRAVARVEVDHPAAYGYGGLRTSTHTHAQAHLRRKHICGACTSLCARIPCAGSRL